MPDGNRDAPEQLLILDGESFERVSGEEGLWGG